jgi:TolB-like protein/DNA-binding winged helix-turn-helix (wHTH) protein
MFPPPYPSKICFGFFELDLKSGELSKHGHRVTLQTQPFRVLKLLLENHGEIISREELQRELWPDGTFVDFQNALSHDVNRIREALSDTAEHPHYIETIPRKGYRFIHPIEPIAPKTKSVKVPLAGENLPLEGVKKGVDREPLALAKQKKNKWLKNGILWAGISFVVMTVVAAGWHYAQLKWSKASIPLIRSVAVLTLDTLQHEHEQEAFAEGLTEELITRLTKIGSLQVTSRRSTLAYKGTAIHLAQIARELNVDAVLEGTLLLSGDRVRVTTQLIHGPTDRDLWAGRYERNIGDVVTCQAEIAEQIGNEIEVFLTSQQDR